MALIVETGAIVAGADSYISLADARTYATSRGLTISSTDGTAEVQLRRAFDYLESFRGRYCGIKATDAQITQWPRYGATLDGVLIDSATIPSVLKYAQVHVAAAIESGLNPTPNALGERFALREKVGPLEVQYSERVTTSGVPILRAADQLIGALLSSSGLLSTERA